MFLAINDAISLDITVSEEGADNSSCLHGAMDCLTLQHALSALKQVHGNVFITITYDQTLSTPHKYQDLTNIAITGLSEKPKLIEIHCNDSNVGLYLTQSINITVSHLQWINCGVMHPTSALGNWSSDEDYLVLPSAYSALFLFNCTNFKLSHTHFSSIYGSGVSLYNLLGNVTIEHSTFVNHTLSNPCEAGTMSEDCSPQSTGLYIEFSYCQDMTSDCIPDQYRINNNNSMFYINNCTFADNDNPGTYHNATDVPPVAGLSREQHWPFGRGGGMGVTFRSFEFKWFEMIIDQCTFHSNRAVYGGGMFLKLEAGFADHWRFGIVNSTFSDNVAEINGGGIDIDLNVIYYSRLNKTINRPLRNHLVIIDTIFSSNKAKWGSGTSFVAYPSNISYVQVQFNRTYWEDNVYTSGAGAIGLLRKETPEQSYFLITKVEFTDCSFTETKPALPYSSSLRLISGTVYSEGIPLEFYGKTLFKNNGASGLALSDTGATFFNYVTFLNNSAFNGGGLYLSGKAYMTVAENSVVEFLNNVAFECGGGIYYMAPGPLEMDTSGSCFVWYHNKDYDVQLKYWLINVTFAGNTAIQSGDAAFISDPQKCVWPNEISLFDPQRAKKFDYSGQNPHNTSHVISTPAKQMRFHFLIDNSSNELDTNASDSKAIPVYEMMPGDGLDIKVMTYDDFNQSVPVVISVQCHKYEDYVNSNFTVDYCSNNGRFAINGNRLIESNQILNNFILSGPEESDDLVLLFKSCQPVTVMLPLRIKFQTCHLGYKYDNDTRSCNCINNNPDVLLCVIDSTSSSISQPCIRHQYWLGHLPHGSPLVYQFCHTGKCIYNMASSGCADHVGYSVLNNFCKNDLSGSLCSSCGENSTLTYNSYSCIENCDASRSIGLVILMFVESFIIIGIILLFLKLNIRISTAGFYGFLYFYSVLQLFIWADIPFGLEVIIALITSITSLDFIILQYFQLCLFNGVHAIHYEVLHYLYPVTVVILILLIIKIDQWCFCKVQFFKGNAAIQALCIILLISYTSVSQTSLKILLPLTYQDASTGKQVEQRYVYVDPDVAYMNPTLHLPYWLIAFVVETCFILPFALLMLLAQWLMRCVNLSRVKPLLDEYQNCFHDNYRWFAGVYLLARQALFLISMVSTGPNQMSYLQQLFCLFLLVVVATLQPYRVKMFNYIDIFFLSLLTLIAMTGYNSTANSMFSLSEDAHQIIIGLLSLVPSVFIFICCLVLFARKICRAVIKGYSTRLNYVLGNDSLSLSSGGGTSSEDLRNTASFIDVHDDLPPRFYDEEDDYRQDEQAKLLQSRRQGRAIFTATRYNTIQTVPPPINAPHTH